MLSEVYANPKVIPKTRPMRTSENRTLRTTSSRLLQSAVVNAKIRVMIPNVPLRIPESFVGRVMLSVFSVNCHATNLLPYCVDVQPAV